MISGASRFASAWLATTGLVAAVLTVAPAASRAQLPPRSPDKFNQDDKFRQLEEILPTPNDYRTASGAPGARYWQQRVDYSIDVSLDEPTNRINGSETITYHNQSPDTLKYLWLQLDANLFRPDSDSNLTSTRSFSPPGGGEITPEQVKRTVAREKFDGGVTIEAVTDAQGAPLPHTIVKTMMRVDLPQPLKPGEQFVFGVKWNYEVNNARLVGGRTGYETFDDGNKVYVIAQWFPRLAAYSDATGWQHKQYLGSGEFTLELGDYDVRITVPEDHILGATGVLQNPEEVLTEEQRNRLEEAMSSYTPIYVVTSEEAKANESKADKPKATKTWHFQAENVRDFAFATSRKFLWDALGVPVGEGEDRRVVLAMSFFPNEGEPLWGQYSTHAIAHTINVYSRFTFEYPYPVAISVMGPVGGMEYPMICFNGPRPQRDGSYSKRTKYALISVVIHEVGHNYFPMIVNSDERQWTWMDEGINTFLQYLAEQEWEENYPSSRGEPAAIANYMKSRDQVPIMTNSESVLQFGNNAYAKPATALNVLRETVLGRELFDFAFREYAQRWKFKRPMPADFFRTMEDASGVDLDWFWRGWFYSTDHCDLELEKVTVGTLVLGSPESAAPSESPEVITLAQERNRELAKRIDAFPELKDQYNQTPEPTEVDLAKLKRDYETFMEKLDPEDRKLFSTPHCYTTVEIRNVGGLVSPIILELQFADGTSETVRIPAEIWRYDAEKVTKTLHTTKEVVGVVLDPRLETADVDTSNNDWPPKESKSRFQLFKSGQGGNAQANADAAAERLEQLRARFGGRGRQAAGGNAESNGQARERGGEAATETGQRPDPAPAPRRPNGDQ